jgi:Cu/Ag efflux pump CusA
MAGFTPLILDGGQFWPPLAVAIGGGVLGATLLGLAFVPSAHLLLTRGKAPRRSFALNRKAAALAAHRACGG